MTCRPCVTSVIAPRRVFAKRVTPLANHVPRLVEALLDAAAAKMLAQARRRRTA